MRIIWFTLAMILSVSSCYIMGQAFAFPEFGLLIFGGGILLATVAFAVATTWNRF